jgi:tetratricopeptide (TPR) repeat protein
MGSATPGQTFMEAAEKLRRYAVPALLGLVMVYAALAGLRTITDADTGWQLASARYIVQHHQIPSTDVLSYTARGKEWIYPVFSELLLYALYLLGGFAALSWLNSLACAATLGIAFLGEAGIAAAVLAILAIPKIAYRTAPRADLFSSVLFAALLVVLWRYHRGRHAPLWLVPAIFLVWANTHLGFIAGFALLAAYAGLELADFPFSERRAAARARLRRALPWLAAALPATLCNPYGWGVYRALLRQERDLASQQNVIAEWRHVPLNAATLREALRWRDPGSSYYWLLALAVVAAVLALTRKRVGPAVLLLGSAYLSVQHIRFQGLFAIVAMVVAAPFLAGAMTPRQSADEAAAKKSRAQRRRELSRKQRMRLPSLARYGSALAIGVLALAVALTGVRAYDVVTERAYIAGGEVNLFGAGISTWYPERAAEFVLREKLPGNIFHDYNLGGFLAFRLGPQYPDYIDGRAIPFGELMEEQRSLMRQPPDSAEWRQQAERRGINTLIFSLARYWGLPGSILRGFCASTNWKPVYLDDVAIVLVRNRPENAPWLSRLSVDCQRARLDPPAVLVADGSRRGRAELFNYYAHAGSILFKLSRNAEAAVALDRALGMFPEEPYLHQIRGQVYQANGQPREAEQEYLTSVRLKPTEAGWYTLAGLYSSQQRYAEAAHALRQAAQVSVHPSQYYLSLGTLYVAMRKPEQAISAFDAAAENSSYEPPEIKAQIDSQAAEGRARAWNAMRATP